jgi:hypothetical protein
MLLEVFTDSAEESLALEQMLSIEEEGSRSKAKQLAKQALGEKGVKALKKALGK